MPLFCAFPRLDPRRALGPLENYTLGTPLSHSTLTRLHPSDIRPRQPISSRVSSSLQEEEEEYRKLEERALVAVAKADYKSDAPGDLCFQAGQLIDDLVEEEGGWWSGEIDGKRGIFPNTYVRFMPKEMAAKAQTLSAPPTTSMVCCGGAHCLGTPTFTTTNTLPNPT